MASEMTGNRQPAAGIIETPLAHLSDEELQIDVREFKRNHLKYAPYSSLLRAARVGKNAAFYDEVARRPDAAMAEEVLVHLTPEERSALRRERDVPFSEKGMFVVIATVSLAALLQGFVQSSLNGASMYRNQFGLKSDSDQVCQGQAGIGPDGWKLGAVNGAPFLFAALIGCPLSLPVNYWFGRRGGIFLAALLIFISSLAAAFATSWKVLFAIRIINGLGMGIKAVSTPILASETAVGFWRGSAILAWQLWVAFGIMMGFAVNLLFTVAETDRVTYSLIQGSPMVPSLALLVIVFYFCPESPRYHLMKGPNYNMDKAYQMLLRLRNTELQALRDLYVIYKSLERAQMGSGRTDPEASPSPEFKWVMRDFARSFLQLFSRRRLYNAVISSCVVNLSQQLCGVNVVAFYSGPLFFKTIHDNDTSHRTLVAMEYSLGFGAINFLFALPAVRSIDTLGRRKWLLITLPCLAIFMLGASMSYKIHEQNFRGAMVIIFIFVLSDVSATSNTSIVVDASTYSFQAFAVCYSPAMGPIPFTLASESFPLSHREAGTALAISTNLFFAGILSLTYPRVDCKLGSSGALGLFSGLNVLAFILVLLLVEETKRHSLEELDVIFDVPKIRFIRFQLFKYLPWWVRTKVLGVLGLERPELYENAIWGPNEAVELPTWPSLQYKIDDDMEPVEIGVPHGPDGPVRMYRRQLGLLMEEIVRV